MIKAVPQDEHGFPVGESSITYIGHATTLLHLDGLNIITDPIFSEYIGRFAKRYVEPGIPFERLPAIDAIVISHEHWDHLDKPTLNRFAKDIPVIVSRGLAGGIKALGFHDVRELSWWESTKLQGAVVTAVPAKHMISHPSGFVIEHTKSVIFFAGDTGLFDGFREIGQRFTIDVALLPIGDYRPHLAFVPGLKAGMRAQHMAPGDMPEAIAMLKSKMVIPIHWGTFKISGTGLDEPVEWLKRIIGQHELNGKVFILKHGEKLVL
ncbi:MAG: MBL fold metallo-hydrolase [Spirochaetota bacterium]